MKCAFCDFSDTQVRDSRPSDDGDYIKRRRHCPSCGARFFTTERREIQEIKVLKRSGVQKPFDIQKIAQSLRIATRRRPVNDEMIDQIVSRTIKKIEKSGEAEIRSQLIGELIMDELAQIDQVSYVRYASVYKDFNSINDFSSFIKIMTKENNV